MFILGEFYIVPAFFLWVGQEQCRRFHHKIWGTETINNKVWGDETIDHKVWGAETINSLQDESFPCIIWRGGESFNSMGDLK